MLAGASRDVTLGDGALEAVFTDYFSHAPSLTVCKWKSVNSSGRLSNMPKGKQLHSRS